MPPLELRACIDVDDLEKGIAFYTQALGLRVGRRPSADIAELLGASSPIDLLAKAPGTSAHTGTHASMRAYRRHWTPVHLDFVVPNLHAAVQRAQNAGAVLEGTLQTFAWGRMANMADPFGHGFCLIELQGRGYDAMSDA